MYVLTRDGDEFLKIQRELLLTILDEVAAARTALALPTPATGSGNGRSARMSKQKGIAAIVYLGHSPALN